MHHLVSETYKDKNEKDQNSPQNNIGDRADILQKTLNAQTWHDKKKHLALGTKNSTREYLWGCYSWDLLLVSFSCHLSPLLVRCVRHFVLS